MIRMFVSDLDGTLLIRHQTDAYIQSVIRKALDNGYYFVVCTGRKMNEYEREGLVFDHPLFYMIYANGSLMEKDKEIISAHPIDPAFVDELLTVLPHSTLKFHTAEKEFVTCSQNEYFDHLDHAFGKNIPQNTWNAFTRCAQYDADLTFLRQQKIYKIETDSFEDEYMSVLDPLLKRSGKYIWNQPAEPDNVELSAAGSSKGRTLKELVDLLGLKNEEVAVYGDGKNDQEMIEMFKNSYCPAEAYEGLKKIVKETLGPCECHSISKHIEETIDRQGKIND